MFLPQPSYEPPPQRHPRFVAQQFVSLIELKNNDLDDTGHKNRNRTFSRDAIPLYSHREINCKFVVPPRILHDISEQNANTKWYSM